jgi:hypothetical protein
MPASPAATRASLKASDLTTEPTSKDLHITQLCLDQSSLARFRTSSAVALGVRTATTPSTPAPPRAGHRRAGSSQVFLDGEVGHQAERPLDHAQALRGLEIVPHLVQAPQEPCSQLLELVSVAPGDGDQVTGSSLTLGRSIVAGPHHRGV